MKRYIKYGPKWKKEISKMRKQDIVNLASKLGMTIEAKEHALKELTKLPEDFLRNIKADLEQNYGYDFASEIWTDNMFELLSDIIISTVENSIKFNS